MSKYAFFVIEYDRDIAPALRSEHYKVRKFEFDTYEECLKNRMLCANINWHDPNIEVSWIAEEKDKSDETPISWDKYFMEIAKLTAQRSKDSNTKVGACIVDPSNRIIGTGYNWFPAHVDESSLPTSREGAIHESKYGYVVHAEANAIMNSPVFDLTNARIYCTLFPCNECAKMIVQKGIKKVIYLSDKHHDDPIYIASRKLLTLAKVEVEQYKE